MEKLTNGLLRYEWDKSVKKGRPNKRIIKIIKSIIEDLVPGESLFRKLGVIESTLKWTLQYWDNYDPEKSENILWYFTELSKRGLAATQNRITDNSLRMTFLNIKFDAVVMFPIYDGKKILEYINKEELKNRILSGAVSPSWIKNELKKYLNITL